jgi:hypothetical protein
VRSGVALVLSALLLAACGNASAARVNSTTVPSTTRRSPWCVPISREKAIANATRGGVSHPSEVAAKLVNGTELHTLSPAVTVSGAEFDPTSLYWAVEVRGTVTDLLGGRGSYAWAVYNIDARTGDIGGVEAGPQPKSPRFAALPDHSGECTS